MRPKSFHRTGWAALAATLAVLSAGLAAPAAAQATTPTPGAAASPTASAAAPSPVAATPTPVAVTPAKAAPKAGAEPCGGSLPFGQIVTCPSISGDERHLYTVTTQRNGDVLYATFHEGDGEPVHAAVTAPDGTHACYLWSSSQCQLGAVGTYTITVTVDWGGTNDYTVAVDSLKTPSSCTQLPNAFFSFASPGITATLPNGSAGHCYRFNQPVGSVLQLRALGHSVRGAILDANSQPVCPIADTTECRLDSAGPYRFFLTQLYGAEATYTLRMSRLSQSAGCPLLRPAAFGDPGDNTGTGIVRFDGDLACHKIRTSAAGPVLVRIADSQLLWWDLYDDAGAKICDQYSQSRACALPTVGDYTLVVRSQTWDEKSYQVAVTALIRNAGCAPATGTEWTGPTLSVRQLSPVGTQCQPFRGRAGDRILTFVAPTVYNEVSAWIVDSTGTGTTVCPGWPYCQFPAAGRYTLVVGSSPGSIVDNDVSYAVSFLPVAPSGCATAGDDGTVQHGQFGVVGEVDCFELPSAAGSKVVRLTPGDAAGVANPQLTVFDATGGYVCDAFQLYQYSCELTGTAPFFVVADNQASGEPTGDYQLAFRRVAAPPSCPVLTRDPAGLTVTSGSERFGFCFTVPADQHAVREAFRYQRISGTGDATISIFDESGIRHCYTLSPSADRTLTCTLPDGLLTVLLETDAVDATYQVTHRDASTP
ncbi:hypothetical protein O7626_30995 [Micromonospora sp. WMMD1102]|uniref:hypothetical protein n=1 Tax=Micromonospora sp. WMMD1102 TaxID=3016105 RepID=UPI00241588D4|nr:hypothetical protein [Micromonospora sp. WMMD1102]MDG4790298.1 hypothetical protein [Micromonospora sp. WMMD1102]